MGNPETLETLGTQDTGRRQKTIKMSKTDPTNNRWLNSGIRECNVTRIDKVCSTPLHAKQTQKA
jgi:hypothetical protein